MEKTRLGLITPTLLSNSLGKLQCQITRKTKGCRDFLNISF